MREPPLNKRQQLWGSWDWKSTRSLGKQAVVVRGAINNSSDEGTSPQQEAAAVGLLGREVPPGVSGNRQWWCAERYIAPAMREPTLNKRQQLWGSRDWKSYQESLETGSGGARHAKKRLRRGNLPSTRGNSCGAPGAGSDPFCKLL
ncbi:hypothetical protein NDU88_007498 [Pleurodeles waltl]|uniref:Uncharacterized protein n=1 Tax=Pleurodeles waltl TaxID=8319 RepID=A0AAV7VU06_PLEWA|nr:hypothetical protein NDU88_007498 [Pleurodeles waltl]